MTLTDLKKRRIVYIPENEARAFDAKLTEKLGFNFNPVSKGIFEYRRDRDRMRIVITRMSLSGKNCVAILPWN